MFYIVAGQYLKTVNFNDTTWVDIPTMNLLIYLPTIKNDVSPQTKTMIQKFEAFKDNGYKDVTENNNNNKRTPKDVEAEKYFNF